MAQYSGVCLSILYTIPTLPPWAQYLKLDILKPVKVILDDGSRKYQEYVEPLPTFWKQSLLPDSFLTDVVAQNAPNIHPKSTSDLLIYLFVSFVYHCVCCVLWNELWTSSISTQPVVWKHIAYYNENVYDLFCIWCYCLLQRPYQIRLDLAPICIIKWFTMCDQIVMILCVSCVSRVRRYSGCIWKPSISKILSKMEAILEPMHSTPWGSGFSTSESSLWTSKWL